MTVNISADVRPIMMDDPSHGLQVNSIKLTRRVSRGVWKADVGRTSDVTMSFTKQFSIHDQAHYANRFESFINYRHERINGRSN